MAPKLLHTTFLFLVAYFQAYELGHVLHAVDDVLNLAARPEDRGVDRTPIPLLEPAVRVRDVVLLHRHRVRLTVGDDACERRTQRADAGGGWVVGVVGESLEDAATNQPLTRRTRSLKVRVVRGDDAEALVGPKDQVRPRHRIEDRAEIESTQFAIVRGHWCRIITR